MRPRYFTFCSCEAATINGASASPLASIAVMMPCGVVARIAVRVGAAERGGRCCGDLRTIAS